jgi:hypothetical protein
VLTHGCESARCEPVDNTTIHSQDDANSAQNIADAILEIAGNNCAAGISSIHLPSDRCTIDVVTAAQSWLKGGCADSESRFLAMKKFLRLAALRLIGARQNRFFARIATTDSATPFFPIAPLMVNDWCMRALDAMRR